MSFTGQLFTVTLGIVIILSLIFIVSKIKSKNNIKNLDKLSLSIIYNFSTNEKVIENLQKLLLQKSNFVKLISLVKSDANTTVNVQIQLKNFHTLNNLINSIQKKNIKVVVAQSDIIAN